MHALVTGGAGFLGSALVDRLLAEGHTVEVVDDLSSGRLANLADARTAGRGGALSIHNLDIGSPRLVEVVERRRPEVVFHLAARTDAAAALDDPVALATVNIVGSVNVIEAARRSGARKVVFASAGAAIYGEVHPDDLPVDETTPQRPINPAGVAKKAVADQLAAYRALYRLDFTVLAFGAVYGPRQAHGAVATNVRRLLAGAPALVHGDGTQTRDFVFVDDAVDALVRASGTSAGGLLLNIGTGVGTSINQLVEMVADAAGCAPPIAVERGAARRGEAQRSALDSARAARTLGWRAWTALADGIAATVAAARSAP